MEIRLLGPLEGLDASGRPLRLGGGKQRALLAVLLLNLNRTVPVETLVDDLWGDDVPETATKAVQIYVSQLRKVLPRDVLVTRAPGYVLELPEEDVDLYRFERLLEDGRAALAAGDAARASELLRDALALWRGQALGEFTEPFAQVERRRLEERRLTALEERIEADLALGRHADLVGELDALTRRAPLRERLRGQQMVALYRCGRQADALAAYQELRRTLDEELGIEPSKELRDLERRMLQQDPALHLSAAGEETAAAPARTPAASGAPAPAGLTAGIPASPGEAPPIFVGRKRELGLLEEALEQAAQGRRQLVCLTGEAGIGKTTLVQAFLGRASSETPMRIAQGRCIEHHGPGEAYLPVLEALARLCREPGAEGVVGLLTERAPTWLAQLPGLVPAEKLAAVRWQIVGATRERMLREMVELLDELAAETPLVLLLEDLHWSDYSTIDLLTALASRPEPARLLVLATYRPGDALTAGHPLHLAMQELRLRRRARHIALHPLGERAIDDYLRVRFPNAESRKDSPHASRR